MSYGNSWDADDGPQMAMSQEWVSSEDMLQLLSHLDSVKIAISEQRTAALDYIASVAKKPPFGPDRRFPQAPYVAINTGDWPSKLAQLTSALNYKELNQTREGKERFEVRSRAQNGSNRQNQEVEPTEEDEPKTAIPNDVIRTFTKAVSNMRAELGRSEGVWTRRKFERSYGLTWA